ncbi:MAG: cyoA [Candidatus Paceibacter sp.]|jgi:cytochrome o ubiquinol oxidase subunit 2|nr:cyoA [Candidatus Paceibacter sp.]
MSTIEDFFHQFAIFNPKGFIAIQQKELLIVAVLLMLIIVIPAYIMLFTTAWKYRAEKSPVKNPEDNQSTKYVYFFWAAPAFIILILSLITWQKTHELDPYKAITSENPPITIQVVALEWKWLFIYPEQDIATVNFIQVPVNTPINFVLTSDAAMNSLWIPELGGQMYAMSGMSSRLNLIANEVGDFKGAAAEINGAGFAGMRFVTRSSTQADFDQWVMSVKASSRYLSYNEYELLSKPSENVEPVLYSGSEPGLYDRIIMKYMSPTGGTMEMNHN